MSRSVRLVPLLLAAGCAGTSAEGGGVDTGSADRPLTCPPPDLLAAALCVCEDFAEVGQLTIADGPSGGGSVGVNGHTSFVNQTRASGSWVAYGGFDVVADAEIAGDLVTAGDASWVGRLAIGGDLGIGGDASGVGELAVGGALRVAGDESVLGPSQIGARAEYQAPAGPPCGCDGDDLFDVAAAVAAARDANDNAAAGLPDRLAEVGVTELALGGGSYYFADAATVGQTRFVISGSVSLFFDGELAAVGDQSFTLEPGATLDLFVAGGVATVGRLSAGNASDPEAFRLYVGGDAGVLVSVGQQVFYGSIYAPEAEVAWVGDTHVVGAVFARSLAGVGRLEIEYGAPAVLEPDACEPPGDGGGGDDGGGDDGGDDGGDVPVE